jgi:hypothetical protein
MFVYFIFSTASAAMAICEALSNACAKAHRVAVLIESNARIIRKCSA